MQNAESQNKEQRFSQEQYNMLMHCSEKRDMTEWNQRLKDDPGEKILLMGANFLGAHLKGVDLTRADLECAKFGFAHLENAELGHANLKSASLFKANLHGANLGGARLEGADARQAHLVSANLGGANLNDIDLANANLESVNLVNAKLEAANLIQTQLEGANLAGARLDGADMRHIRLGIGEYEEFTVRGIRFTSFKKALLGNAILSLHPDCMDMSKKAIEALSKAEVNNVRFIDPVFGRKVRDEAWLCHYKRHCRGIWWKKLISELWWLTSDYGRSFLRWAFVSLIIAIMFGAIYSFHYPHPGEESSFNFKGYPEETVSVFTPFYYSIVTFTTLGFGDVTPKISCWWAQAIVTVEVVLGYIMLGGLISILANKLARRND